MLSTTELVGTGHRVVRCRTFAPVRGWHVHVRSARRGVEYALVERARFIEHRDEVAELCRPHGCVESSIARHEPFECIEKVHAPPRRASSGHALSGHINVDRRGVSQGSPVERVVEMR